MRVAQGSRNGDQSPFRATLCEAMTTDAPLRRDAAANRERILDAARRLFFEQGLHASMDEVARAAGVGPATLYRRFPTKEALLDAILGDVLERFHAFSREA